MNGGYCMQYLDIDNWSRKDHYNYFKQLDYPHFNICANLDITVFYDYIKEQEMPFFISLLYVATKAANQVKEFRYRIREDGIVVHDVVSPSFTVMTEGDVFSFCTTKYMESYSDFSSNAADAISNVKHNISIEDEPGRDDLLYITSIPWVSFTSITHPIQMKPTDCIPRISWGKFYEENGKKKLPFSVQAHHALVDGLHVGQYYQSIQELLDHPSE